MIRVLFVDDDLDLLEGLENRLRSLRKKWKMRFALGGSAALEHLDAQPFDVVVTDMRMTGMDGAELLRHVKERSPETVRIVLSGYANEDQFLRALPLAHEFLSKPCDRETLKVAIERATSLRDQLHDPAVMRIVADVGCLATVPRCYRAVRDALESVHSCAQDIANIIEDDPAITARVLHIANSAYFGGGRRIQSVAEAVSQLGSHAIRSIVLNESIFSALGDPDIRELQSLSIESASFARHIAPDDDAAFSAALLHAIGQLILVANDADTDVSDATVGAALLSLWGIPAAIVYGVAHYSQPSSSAEQEFGVAGIVHVAVQIARAKNLEALELDEAYLKRTRSTQHVSAWWAACRGGR